ncbi:MULTISPECIES: 5-(carboxyamino)imidazole ribonucleotide synthase [unclassified Synechococcus]|uniref:5-(carboxyamino)imidazole ribonucleotide synthase n=1 Tax=unclassified Synechococcus TaxID=2626047 RepID=UPI0021A9641B|nr:MULTISPECIES: 5-(carboxyamino)imidazole ribonucleotide synthase [unclassified Synechococcus]MCT0214508.1 5-(carboxyamino)imidazole ribonucleotide synthase [Synechococcus sp. CS-1326]MCT0233189.1 5-(carboxyamino)imidazole ribonucleotide synthase [Synechococcus sp. CS-1327]
MGLDRAIGGSIGVVGGGQLALMLAEAASQANVQLHVQTPLADDPATRLATSVVLAPLDDLAATRELAQRSEAISFENEWVDLDALKVLETEGVVFLPKIEALRPLVCKRAQRELLYRLNLPSPQWIALEELLPPPLLPSGSPLVGVASPGPATQPASSLPDGFSFPVMAKASTGGYDGRGTRLIHDQEELNDLLERVRPTDWLLEEFVRFEQELAMVACRDRHGSVACFPLVQTHQHQQICDWVIAPAAVSQAVEARARNVAASLLTSLDYVGVLSIEFFFGPAGLQINELAPRTHNSGHYTIEATHTSQFAQQLRIVCGQPLGETGLKRPGALMVNLLGYGGSDHTYEEQRQVLAALPGATLHWYGKSASLPGRKLGHLTIPLNETDPQRRAAEARSLLEEVRRVWPLPLESGLS